MASNVYAYAGMGTRYVHQYLPTKQPEKTTGEEAERIHASADFICTSCYRRDGDHTWIIHNQADGSTHTIPLYEPGQYEYLAEECEKIAGKDGLTILFA